MTVRLRVNLKNGDFEAEGDEAFVRELHEKFLTDFRQNVKVGATSDSIEPNEPSLTPAKTRKAKKKTGATPNTSKRESGYVPKTVRDFDPEGLSEFYEQFSPKNNSERILICGKFLTEKRGNEKFSADEIFTCFRILKLRIPKAAWQAFIDTRSKFTFVDFDSPEEIWITHIGDNHFEHDLARQSDTDSS